MLYPGAPMFNLHDEKGNFFDPTNWQHATMYFWFGVSGLADIITFTARHIVPGGTAISNVLISRLTRIVQITEHRFLRT